MTRLVEQSRQRVRVRSREHLCFSRFVERDRLGSSPSGRRREGASARAAKAAKGACAVEGHAPRWWSMLPRGGGGGGADSTRPERCHGSHLLDEPERRVERVLPHTHRRHPRGNVLHRMEEGSLHFLVEGGRGAMTWCPGGPA